MTSALSRQFFETFPPEVARAILEGRPLRIHAAKVSVVYEDGEVGFAIDTLPRDGRPKGVGADHTPDLQDSEA